MYKQHLYTLSFHSAWTVHLSPLSTMCLFLSSSLPCTSLKNNFHWKESLFFVLKSKHQFAQTICIMVNLDAKIIRKRFIMHLLICILRDYVHTILHAKYQFYHMHSLVIFFTPCYKDQYKNKI